MRFMALLFLLFFSSNNLPASSLGLLDQPQTFPWTIGIAPVLQEEAGGLDAGHSRVRSSVLWFNTFRQYGFNGELSQLIDLEGLIGVVSYAWAPSSGWELRAQVQGWVIGGGITDPFLDAFHTLLSVPNQGREQSARNSYRNYLEGNFDDQSPGAGLTQTSLGIRRHSGPWAWTSWIKLPLPSRPGWGWVDRWTTGSSLAWGDRWPWPEYGVIVRGGLSSGFVIAGDFLFQGGGYLIFEAFSGPRALIQGNWTAPSQMNAGYLSQGSGLLSLGVQFPLSKGRLTHRGVPYLGHSRSGNSSRVCLEALIPS